MGPVANTLSDGLTNLFQAIMNFNPIVFGLVLGILWQVLVMFGMHWALIPLAISDVATNGSLSILSAALLPCFTQTGVLGAIMLKTKEEKVRTISMPAFVSSIFGVTEPAIYGITLPRKKPFILSCVVGALTGGILGVFGSRIFMVGGMGIFAIPTFIGPAGIDKSFLGIIVASIVGLIVGFILMYFTKLDHEDMTDGKVEKVENNLEKDALVKQEVISSPIKGDVLPLNQVKDEVFSAGLLGKGVAIEPKEGKVVSPVDGTLTTLFPTHHALGITSDNGAEILIHVGMDTVQLEGKCFTPKAKQGDKIKAGQVLLEFDIDGIKEAGYPVTTPVIISNSDNYLDIIGTEKKEINREEELLTVMI